MEFNLASFVLKSYQKKVRGQKLVDFDEFENALYRNLVCRPTTDFVEQLNDICQSVDKEVIGDGAIARLLGDSVFAEGGYSWIRIRIYILWAIHYMRYVKNVDMYLSGLEWYYKHRLYSWMCDHGGLKNLLMVDEEQPVVEYKFNKWLYASKICGIGIALFTLSCLVDRYFLYYPR